MDFTDKDPWGYHFAQPIWKLDPSSEMLKRDPLDRERERINLVLEREFELAAKDLNEGFDAEMIPWSSFHEDNKLARRRLFAEALRREALESRTGLLGMAQVHFLATKHGLMQTLACKAPVAAFPLELDIVDPILREQYRATYVLQIDRVFYPVQKLPQLNRFGMPFIVVDAFRIFDAGGESRVRSGDKKVLATITTASKPDRDTPLHWVVERGKLPPIELKEGKTQEATLFCEGRELGSILHKPDNRSAHGLDYTLRFDGQGEREPLLGLFIAFLDATVQRKQGVLERARAANDKMEPTNND